MLWLSAYMCICACMHTNTNLYRCLTIPLDGNLHMGKNRHDTHTDRRTLDKPYREACYSREAHSP